MKLLILVSVKKKLQQTVLIEKREKKAVALETYIALSCSCVGIWWVEGMLRNDCFIFCVCLNENKLLSIDVFITKARIMFQNHLFFIVQQKRKFLFSFLYSLTVEKIMFNCHENFIYWIRKEDLLTIRLQSPQSSNILWFIEV